MQKYTDEKVKLIKEKKTNNLKADGKGLKHQKLTNISSKKPNRLINIKQSWSNSRIKKRAIL